MPTRPGVAGLACLGVYGLFWMLNTSVPYRAPLSEGLALVLSDTARWLAGLLGIAALGWWALARGTPASLRRRCISVCLILAASGAGLHACSELTDPSSAPPLGIRPSARERPHVFVVLVDTLRADHVSAYAYRLPTTPNLDALAEDATTYMRAFSQAPWTRPAVGSLLTSLYHSLVRRYAAGFLAAVLLNRRAALPIGEPSASKPEVG